MDVQVRCFALLREVSADRTTISVADGARIEDAWAEMARRHPGLAPHRPFVRAARKAKVRLSTRKTGFLVSGPDRVGACSALLDKLARAKINVTAIDAVTAGGGKYAALLWVKRRDLARATRVLRAR